ncbi:MAG: peptidase [Synechococcales bacterium]|nr:peptidase [Synechococcales bacterium]
MNRSFRKYHRLLAPIMALPLALTILTGMLVTMNQEWPFSFGIPSSLLLKIHTGEIFGLGAIYPVLNGIGLIGLLVTGLTMSGLFRTKRRPT